MAGASGRARGRVRKYTRRAVLGLALTAAGGVAVGYYYYRRPFPNPLAGEDFEGQAIFNPYVVIAPDNRITIITPRAEMGQGVQTTLAALVAEELDVSLDRVTTAHGPAASVYYNEAMFVEGGPFPFFDESLAAEMTRGAMKVVSRFLALQVTGGSSATVDGFDKMRRAGAAARHVLVAAAAERWGVDPQQLKTSEARIVNPNTGATLTYGEVAKGAAAMEPPAVPKLKRSSEWELLGKSQSRIEIVEKVTGAPIFGIDMQLPDMLHATVKMSPRFGSGWRSVRKSGALAVRGVVDVVELETTTGKGFGIVAENSWAAFKGAAALEVDWEEADYPADDEAIGEALEEALSGEPDFELGGRGDVEAAFSGAPGTELVEATYEAPYLAHLTMEPMNATARFRDGKLEIWAGTQAPGLVQMACASLLGIDVGEVTVNTTFLGGGFGRRAEVDFALYAAAIAARTGGRPVKVTWSREEDIRHDVYRPAARGRFRARLDGKGRPVALDAKIASPSVLNSLMRRIFPAIRPIGPEKIMLEGAYDQPAEIAHRRYQAAIAPVTVPVGFWRSVGNSFNGFFHECFIDEMAVKAERDPLDFRLAMMEGDAYLPAREVLMKVAEMSGWRRPPAAGRGRGLAHVISFGTWVAQVVEVALVGEAVRIEKVWCAADPGLVLDPGNFRAQMMSGIVFGLSQAISQKIRFEKGEVVNENIPDFDAVRLGQCPEMEIALLENSPRMGGAGEPGTPPAAPALANAIHAATGRRIRRLPLGDEVEFV